MKKKIINGILIVAALFATSTSFVSCKDNVDDAIADVYVDMNSLQSRIDDLNGKITLLESSVLKNSQDIASLQAEVASLQSQLTALQTQVNQNTADIAANKVAIEELTNRIDALEESVNSLLALINNLAVGVTVRATIDPVIGSINLPGYNPLFLAAYAGENFSGITQFPIAGDDFNVDLAGNDLLQKEIVVDPVWINEGDSQGETWWNGLIMGYKHNAGTLYFTLNPIGLDASNLSFDLVNSLGTVSPVTIDNVQQSSYINSPSLGKHGNGSESGEDIDNPYLFSAEATIPLEANADLAWNKEVNSQLMLDNLNHDLSLLIAQVKAGYTAESILTSSITTLQNFYQAWYKNLAARQYQNLRVIYNDGNGTERIITSPENIVTATVSPLSYKLFYDLGGAMGGLTIDHELLESLIGKFVGVVQSQLPTIKNITIEKMAIGNTEGYLFGIDGKYTYEWENGVGTWFDEDGNRLSEEEVVKGGFVELSTMLDEIVKQMNGKIDVANQMIQKVLKEYNVVRTGSSVREKLAERAEGLLANAANGLITSLGSNPAFNAVTPIVLFDSKDGIQRLVDYTTITFGPEKDADIDDDDFPLVLTSATNEYLVPAYKKYVAIIHGDKPVFGQLLDGSEKILNVKLPIGESEIIYSTVDYNGYTVTKRYHVTRKAYGK